MFAHNSRALISYLYLENVLNTVLLNILFLCFIRLATVQEARSKTPNSISMRPNTPGPLLFRKDQAWEDPEVYKNRVMEEVKRIRIDHAQRMESIQVGGLVP